ncbi:hypothetical protein [Marinicellulosiphila megalodicopiae]|uniref:hypothetical protein n=1 Tax=Marinicellulosiphila megalodicopiae TaxID=2724896 RepID=UPI003BB1E55B
MSNKQPTVEEFKKHVENHSMQVLSDNGVNRTLEFRNNGSSNRYFTITTWSNHLCISGDMGTFVFARLEDMFNFFRSDDDELNIQGGYWSEKLEAGKHMAFDQDRLVTALYKRIYYYFEIDDDQFNEIYEDEDHEHHQVIVDLKDNVIDCIEEYNYASLINDFESPSDHNPLEDFFIDCGYECESPTYHYVWCKYAIVWAIKQYDASKKIESLNRIIKVTYSIDGMRRGLSNKLKELKNEVESFIEEYGRREYEELADITDDLICQSNSFNCVSVKEIEDFSDMSDLEIDAIRVD